VKVATRITVAAAVVVAIASATYALYDLRERVAERRAGIEREARALANTVRVSLEAGPNETARAARNRVEQLTRELETVGQKLGDGEETAPTPEHPTLEQQRAQLEQRLQVARSQGGLGRPLDVALAYRPPTEADLRELSRASGGWHLAVIPRSATTSPAGTTPAQLRRLATLVDVPDLMFTEVDAGQFLYAIPLRVITGAKDNGTIVIGVLEVTKPAELTATGDDYARAAVLVVLIVVVTTVMVGALASRFVSRPITKLLRGIDDVAKGDLSHAILSERDDEIGAIATRFNDMTYSLRESRAETQRQNEAKLALEQRLGQTEKLATIGQLAAEIAHEVGTPLNVIAGRASRASSSGSSTSRAARSATPSAPRSTSRR
jgi:HAMP domain-containing protein